MTYDPKDYWENRLSAKFDLSRVGTLGFTSHYNNFLYRAKLRTLKKALLQLNIDIRDKTVCDIGCGTGFFVDFYHFHGAKDITGIDITHASISKLRNKYPNQIFIQENISAETFSTNITTRFDIVNAFDILYHITDEGSFRQSIINISRLAKDDGFIFITDKCGNEMVQPAEHVKFRTRETYKTILETNKISIIGIYPLYFLLNRPILAITRNPVLGKLGSLLDNLLASLYYFIDGVVLSANNANLNLLVGKKRKK